MIRFAFALLCLLAAASALSFNTVAGFEDFVADDFTADESVKLVFHDIQTDTSLASSSRQGCVRVKSGFRVKKTFCGKGRLEAIVRIRVVFGQNKLPITITIDCKSRKSINQKSSAIRSCMKNRLPKCNCKGDVEKCIRKAANRCGGRNKTIFPLPTLEP